MKEFSNPYSNINPCKKTSKNSMCTASLLTHVEILNAQLISEEFMIYY